MRRHATRSKAASFTAEEMAAWYRPHDVLPHGIETLISQDQPLAVTVEQVMTDLALPDLDLPEHPD